jgi:hypothetical protein
MVDFDPKSVKAHPKVLKFYDGMKQVRGMLEGFWAHRIRVLTAACVALQRNQEALHASGERQNPLLVD